MSTVRNRGNFANTSLSEIVELSFSDAINAQIATDPEVLPTIFNNLKHAIVEQPFIGGVACKAPVFETIQTTVIGANPQFTIAVFMDGAHITGGQFITSCVGGENTVAIFSQPCIGADP
jgi:hypothetical protein